MSVAVASKELLDTLAIEADLAITLIGQGDSINAVVYARRVRDALRDLSNRCTDAPIVEIGGPPTRVGGPMSDPRFPLRAAFHALIDRVVSWLSEHNPTRIHPEHRWQDAPSSCHVSLEYVCQCGEPTCFWCHGTSK
jgi:hypothetical protein